MSLARLLVIFLVAGCGGSGSAADSGSACHGLSLEDCRLTDGCTPDRCDGCGCDLTYRGCLATSETPAMCPALGCPSGICCSAGEACAPSAGACTPPGAPAGCGACNTQANECAVDADCGAHEVCDPIACSCQGNRACVAGCTDDSTCAEGTTCDLASGRCQPIACGAGCPSNFACVAGSCARASCTDDLACDGYCVDGACYAQRGACRQPAP